MVSLLRVLGTGEGSEGWNPQSCSGRHQVADRGSLNELLSGYITEIMTTIVNNMFSFLPVKKLFW
jgi:hypothetical protein